MPLLTAGLALYLAGGADQAELLRSSGVGQHPPGRRILDGAGRRGDGYVDAADWKSFVCVDRKADPLSAWFNLACAVLALAVSIYSLAVLPETRGDGVLLQPAAPELNSPLSQRTRSSS